MKALVGAFNQEKALVGPFPVITNLRMELFEALVVPPQPQQKVESKPSGSTKLMSGRHQQLRLVSIFIIIPLLCSEAGRVNTF